MKDDGRNEDAGAKDDEPERLLTTEETAAMLGMAPNTLAKGRMEGNRRHPPHIKIGRAVRYSTRDLSAFIRSRKRGGDHQFRRS